MTARSYHLSDTTKQNRTIVNSRVQNVTSGASLASRSSYLYVLFIPHILRSKCSSRLPITTKPLAPRCCDGTANLTVPMFVLVVRTNIAKFKVSLPQQNIITARMLADVVSSVGKIAVVSLLQTRRKKCQCTLCPGHYKPLEQE